MRGRHQRDSAADTLRTPQKTSSDSHKHKGPDAPALCSQAGLKTRLYEFFLFV